MNNEQINPNELCDEVLDAVSGGISANGSEFNAGERVRYTGLGGCSHCKGQNVYGVIKAFVMKRNNSNIYAVLRMECCNNEITTSDFTKA